MLTSAGAGCAGSPWSALSSTSLSCLDDLYSSSKAAGIWLALVHAFVGILLCLTIIGIPLGLANFKLIPLALLPFGKDIVKNGSTTEPSVVTF